MSLIITLLTGILVLDCLFLILLILMQLPKKEAGLGQAFGGSATDALFGAGSGSVLTKATKYAAGIFFGLALLLTILGPRANPEKRRARTLEEGLANRPGKVQTTPAPAPAPAAASGLTTTGTNLLKTTPVPAPAAAPVPAPVQTNK
jgi:preprotein translocase subunit SecG